MKIKTDKIIKENDIYYDEYQQRQLVVDLDVGETVTVLVNGVEIKSYTALFSNCHFNMVIQDKGEQAIDLTRTQELDRAISELQRQKTEEELKETSK